MADGPATGDGRAELFDEPLIGRLAGGRRRRDRAWLTGLIHQHLADEECRIVLLTGAPGAGKSTIMGQLAQQHRAWPRYFIRRAGESDSDAHSHEGGVTSFLTQIGFQLLTLRGEDLFPLSDMQFVGEIEVSEIGPEADVAVFRVAEWFTNPFRRQAVRAKLKAVSVQGRATVVEIGRLVTDAGMAPMELEGAALGEPLRRLAAKHPGEQIVVLLDGLDEVRFRDGTTDVARWLTGHQQFPPNLRIVVASRPDNPLLSKLKIGHEASVREVLITAEEHSAQVARDVDGYLRSLAAEAEISSVLTAHGLTQQRFVGEVAPKVGGNFLYLEMIARLLDAQGTGLRPGPATMLPAPDLDWLDHLEALPDELPDFYALLLLNVHSTIGGTPATRMQWEELYHPLLGLLAVTMTPLTSRQFRAFGAISHDQATVDDALERLSFFLDRDQGALDAAHDARFRLHHTAMAEFLTGTGTTRPDRLLYCDPAAWHGRITDHAVRLHQAAGTWRDADPYLGGHLPFHAAEAGRLDELVEDPMYLITAAPDALVPELAAVNRAKPITLVYQQVVPMVRDGNVGGALAHLKLYAQQQGLAGFAAGIPMDRQSSPFLLDFTRWEGVQLRQVLGRHDGEVTGVAVTRGRDRRPLAVTSGHDGRIRTWDLLSGREAEGSPLSAGTWVTALAAGALDSGDAIAVAGDLDGAVRAWDLASGQPIGGPMIGHENAGLAVAAAFTDSGPRVVCRIGDQFRTWDPAALAPAHPPFLPADVARDEPMAAAEWAGRTILAGTLHRGEAGGRVRVWDTATGEPLGPVIEAAPTWITAIAVAEINEALLVAITDIDLGLQVFDALTGQPWSERRVFFESSRASALTLGIVDRQAVIVVGDDHGQALFRAVPSLRRLGDPVQAHAGRIAALTFGPTGSGNWFASTGWEPETESGQRPASVRFWVPEKSGHNRLFPVSEKSGDKPGYRLTQAAAQISLPEPAESIALGVDDGRMVAMILDGRQATRKDIRSGSGLGTPLGGRNERVSAVAVATVAGRAVAISATYDTGTIRTWDLQDCKPALDPVTGKPLIRRDIEPVRDLAVARLGDRAVAVCAGWGDIHVWDVATGEPTGARLITGPRNIHSLSVGELAGRPIVAYAAGSPNQDRSMAFDLETGTPLEPPRQWSGPSPSAVAITEHAGQTLVVSGGSYLSISAWDPASSTDPAVIQVAGETSVLAATFVRGAPVAICSGRMGEVRLIDLAADAAAGSWQRPVSGQVWPVKALAVTEVAGQRVVICAHENGVRVLDLVTGEDAAAQPEVRPRSGLAVATGTLHGRPVAVAGGYPNHAWYLDTGESLANQPDWPETAHAVTVADVAGRVIALASILGKGVIIADLETGHRIGDPVTFRGGAVNQVGVVTVSGCPVLIGRMDMGIQARYLDLPWLPPRKAEISYREFATEDETPAPPALFPAKRLTRHPHSGGGYMALGSIDDQPIVISGHERGEIDIFEVASGLPLRPSLGGGESNIAAVACLHQGSREVVAFGALDGTVAVADLTDLSAQTVIRTLASVWAIALAEPDHCVIGTQKGLIAIRLPFPAKTGQAAGARRVRLPVDIRAARACQEHDRHLHRVEKDGHLAQRLCLKGVEQGGIRRADSLSYPGGHCYLLPDRLEIAAAGPEGGTSVPPLVIDLGRHIAEPVEDWEAYLTNGCHFGIGVDTLSKYVVLACYRRSERDWLLAEMRKRLGRK